MSLKHAILGFIDLEPTTGYTLAQRFDGSTASFWSATQSQIYRELHALEQAGLVAMKVVPQDGKPARKVYTLTRDGSRELATWLAIPSGPTQLRDPFLLKFVFAAQLPAAELDAALGRLFDELTRTRAEYRARLAMPEIFSLARSKREALLWRLSIENGLSWCEAQLRWCSRARLQLTAADEKPRRVPKKGK